MIIVTWDEKNHKSQEEIPIRQNLIQVIKNH